MIGSLALQERAIKNRGRVAIGLEGGLRSAEKVINSALFAARDNYIEPVIISSAKPSRETDRDGVVGSELPLIIDEAPERSLVELLKDCSVEAAVRGNLSSKRVVPLLQSSFNCPNLCRVSILEIGGRLVMLAPVGIDEGETMDDLMVIAENSRAMSEKLNMEFKVAILSGGRLEDRGRSQRVDAMLSGTENLAESLHDANFKVKNYGIEIECAIDEGATLLLAPDGIMGNLIFRSLVLVANIDSFGACATALPRVYIDTSRAKSSYLLPMILASALSKS